MLAHLRRFGPRRALVVILTLGLVGIVAVPTMFAAAPSVGPSGPVAALGQAARVGGLGRVLRADATVLKKDGTTAIIHFERGAITAVNSSSITIKGLDGVSTTFAVTAATRVREKGHAAKIGDLTVGERAMVFGKANGSSYDALLIRCVVKPATP